MGGGGGTSDGGYMLTAMTPKTNLVANSMDFTDVVLHLVDAQNLIGC